MAAVLDGFIAVPKTADAPAVPSAAGLAAKAGPCWLPWTAINGGSN